MPKSLDKVQKHIAKKKGKNVTLHANSRDTKMLLRASARDGRVSKTAALREKLNTHFLERLLHIQSHLPAPEEQTTVTPAEMQVGIDYFIARHDEELEELEAKRKKQNNRPPSAREVSMRQNRENEKREYESGFWLPDLRDEKNVDLVRQWKGEWIGLNVVKFIRIDSHGEVKASLWPPKGNS